MDHRGAAKGPEFGVVLLQKDAQDAEGTCNPGRSPSPIGSDGFLTNHKLHGSIEILDLDNLYTFAYFRRFKGTRYLTVLNFSPGAVTWTGADKGCNLEDATLLLSNYDKQSEEIRDPLILRPYEGLVLELERGSG
jgi:hypothetical protein